MKELQKRSFAQSYENDTKRILSFVVQQAFKIYLCSFAMTYYNDIDQLQELSLFLLFSRFSQQDIALIETLDVIIFDKISIYHLKPHNKGKGLTSLSVSILKESKNYIENRISLSYLC